MAATVHVPAIYAFVEDYVFTEAHQDDGKQKTSVHLSSINDLHVHYRTFITKECFDWTAVQAIFVTSLVSDGYGITTLILVCIQSQASFECKSRPLDVHVRPPQKYSCWLWRAQCRHD